MDKNKEEIVRVEGHHELLNTNFDEYNLKRLIKETGKDLVFEAFDTRLNRSIALKVLKPGQSKEREEQFFREGQRLATIDKYDHIPTVYSAGYSNGHYYIAMELINGENLEDAIIRKDFSLEEGVDILFGISEGVSYAHDHGIAHDDIKLENIVFGTTYVVDFGGRLTKTNSNDVIAVGQVGKILLDKHRDRVPKRLEQIIEKALNNKYNNINELRKEIKGYKNSITRRKFLKTTGSLIALSGLGYGGFRVLEYRDSLRYIVDEINNVEAIDYARINPLFNRLLLKIIDHKIDPLTEIIPKNKFPYVTIDSGEWFSTEGGFWTDGFWPGILWQSYKITHNKKYRDLATESSKSIKITNKEGNDMRGISFYYSHAKAYELTGDKFFRDVALEAAKVVVNNRFNEISNCFQISGDMNDNLSSQNIEINSITLLPLVWFAYEDLLDKKTKQMYYNKGYAHMQTVSKYNIRDDYSVRDFAIFNPKEKILIKEETYYGYSPNSCNSKNQAKSIYGFTLAYRITGNKEFLSTAEKLADYFIYNSPDDFVPFYDFNDPNKNIPRDSSAAAIAGSALLSLHNETKKEKYKQAAYNILKSLSAKYLSTDSRNYQGILMHACDNKNSGYNVNNSLIYGDYHFIEALEKIK
ncbi:MAG: Glycosyl hydrolase family 88 [archaeon GW2011_AR20]|nr:MAG: Glycosyl hydrolase family 88 [archaeon GW2011_AR20]AQS33421.1 hypothetical protein [uncultured archaeon]AQS33515.1 hypothetical protein [uncultured archaeon]MBS3161008.1 protein kinase [Candidatus Woesearchaeota archaeon]